MQARESVPSRPRKVHGTRTSRLAGLLLACISLVAALAVACSGGDSDPTATAEPSASPTTSSVTATATTPNSSPEAQLPGTATVESDDGSVTLTIPTGALPAGVEASDIHVTTAFLAEPPLEIADPEADAQPSRVVAVFAMEPDGLRLLRPVTVTFRLPTDVVNGPLVALHISDDGVEPLSITVVDQPELAQIEITTAVEHFSFGWIVTAQLTPSDIVEAEVDAPPTVEVGECVHCSRRP